MWMRLQRLSAGRGRNDSGGCHCSPRGTTAHAHRALPQCGHLEDPGRCVLSTLAAEIARQRPAVRARINAAMNAYRERLRPFLPGKNDAEKRRQFMLLFPSMAESDDAAR